MVMAGCPARDAGIPQQVVALADPFDTTEILGRLDELRPPAGQDHHLEADVSLKMDVRAGADVVAPPMLGRGEPTLHVRLAVIKEHHDARDRVGVGIGEIVLGELLPDEESDRFRAARRVASSGPSVEGLADLRLERHSDPDHALPHG